MNTTESFHADGDRYLFDFRLCTSPKGYAQMDTNSDAWYFDMWANPTERTITTYCEGDLTIQVADDDAEFVLEVRRIVAWHNDQEPRGFRGIDCGLDNDIPEAFTRLGLADLLH